MNIIENIDQYVKLTYEINQYTKYVNRINYSLEDNERMYPKGMPERVIKENERMKKDKEYYEKVLEEHNRIYPEIASTYEISVAAMNEEQLNANIKAIDLRIEEYNNNIKNYYKSTKSDDELLIDKKIDDGVKGLIFNGWQHAEEQIRRARSIIDGYELIKNDLTNKITNINFNQETNNKSK